eukprot:3208110-Prymnesium_polylepis.1
MAARHRECLAHPVPAWRAEEAAAGASGGAGDRAEGSEMRWRAGADSPAGARWGGCASGRATRRPSERLRGLR